VRGLASIGVLQALMERGIGVRKIVATGLSAVAGAYFALGRDPAELVPRFASFFKEKRRFLWGLEQLGGLPRGQVKTALRSIDYFLRASLFCRVNLTRESLFPWSLVESSLAELFGDANAWDFRIPFSVCALDLNTGRETFLAEGKVVELVKAGIAFPGLFPPVSMNGKDYVNSVLYCEVPVGPLVEADRPILAVDIPTRRRPGRPRSLLEVLAWSDELRGRAVKRIVLTRADHILRLVKLAKVPWGSFRSLDRFVVSAKEEALAVLAGFPLELSGSPAGHEPAPPGMPGRELRPGSSQTKGRTNSPGSLSSGGDRKGGRRDRAQHPETSGQGGSR